MSDRIQFIAGYDPYSTDKPVLSVVTIFKPQGSSFTVCESREVDDEITDMFVDRIEAAKYESRPERTDFHEEMQRIIDYYNIKID